ncbi:MAG TPA: hypothetical protein PKY81_17215 [bacterium]|nr:hypothetical protein [bacterium]
MKYILLFIIFIFSNSMMYANNQKPILEIIECRFAQELLNKKLFEKTGKYSDIYFIEPSSMIASVEGIFNELNIFQIYTNRNISLFQDYSKKTQLGLYRNEITDIEKQNPDFLCIFEITDIKETEENRSGYYYIFTELSISLKIFDANSKSKETFYSTSVKKDMKEKAIFYENEWTYREATSKKLSKLFQQSIEELKNNLKNYFFPRGLIVDKIDKENFQVKINDEKFFTKNNDVIIFEEEFKKIDGKISAYQITVAEGIIEDIGKDNMKIKIKKNESKKKVKTEMLVQLKDSPFSKKSNIRSIISESIIEMIPQQKPDWVINEPTEEKDNLIFIGSSELKSSEVEARNEAYRDAVKKFAQYCGIKVIEIATRNLSFEGLASDIKNPDIMEQKKESQVTNIFVSRAKARSWFITKKNIVYSDNTSGIGLEAKVKVEVPQSEYEKAKYEYEQRKLNNVLFYFDFQGVEDSELKAEIENDLSNFISQKMSISKKINYENIRDKINIRFFNDFFNEENKSKLKDLKIDGVINFRVSFLFDGKFGEIESFKCSTSVKLTNLSDISSDNDGIYENKKGRGFNKLLAQKEAWRKVKLSLQ